MNAGVTARKMSYEQYCALERDSLDAKHEYLRGEVLGIPDDERRRLESSHVTATFLTPPAE